MEITVYSKPQCSYCAKAKALLRDREWEFEDLTLDIDYGIEDLMKLIGPDNPRTVPQIVIDGKLVGGHDALVKWLKEYDLQNPGEASF